MVESRDLSLRDDEELASDARGGDHLAFGELYRRYYPVMASYVRPRIGDGADDVVQNVFLAVLRGLSSYRGPRFFPWAYRICVNTVTDELRRRHRQSCEKTAPGDMPEERSDSTPEEELMARRLFGRLSRALEKLPEAQRAVFVLARIEGLDYSEIAELLGIPVGTVKSRMWQAMQSLVPSEAGGRR